MNARTRPRVRSMANQRGVTLLELMMAILVFGIVLVVINNVFFSTNRLYGNTTMRAGQQMNARAGLAVMVTELRTAGCDPGQTGVAPVVSAAGDTVHVNADFDGDGAIETAEPSENILYYYDPGLQAVMRDSGSGPQVMIMNVIQCTFSYFDEGNQPITEPISAADAGRIRSIGITMTTETDGGGQVTATTRVGLRNV